MLGGGGATTGSSRFEDGMLAGREGPTAWGGRSTAATTNRVRSLLCGGGGTSLNATWHHVEVTWQHACACGGRGRHRCRKAGGHAHRLVAYRSKMRTVQSWVADSRRQNKLQSLRQSCVMSPCRKCLVQQQQWQQQRLWQAAATGLRCETAAGPARGAADPATASCHVQVEAQQPSIHDN